MRRSAGFLVLTMGFAFTSSEIEAAGRAPSAVAQVSPELAMSEAYTIYARTLIQIDLLANPQTASLAVVATAFRPGSILLEGKAPTARMREYLISNARRISGLSIESHLEIVDTPTEPLVSTDPRDLEVEIDATIGGFYPELADHVRVTVTKDGVVELNGQINSYEAKLNLSRLVKSQQGCRAVVNLVRVPANAESGEIRISEDGGLRLVASQLPLIPAAPLADLVVSESARPKLRGTAPLMGDDAPAQSSDGVQFVEDARAAISRDPELALLEIEFTFENSALVIAGKIESREKVEKLVELLSEIPSIPKIIVKSRPYSMQRTFPPRSLKPADKDPATWTDKVREWMPWSQNGSPESLAKSWRFRESVRRSLNRLNESRVEEVSVKTSTRGLLIEADVRSARDRAFFLKQVDNLGELRNLPTDVILSIQDAND